MLLARTIDQNIVSYDSISISDDDSIIVEAGVLLQSNGGTITLKAPSITILDNARLDAGQGAVTLTAAANHYELFHSSYWGTVESIYQALSGTSAGVTIGSNVSIMGGSLAINATAGDKQPLGSVPFLGQCVETI